MSDKDNTGKEEPTKENKKFTFNLNPVSFLKTKDDKDKPETHGESTQGIVDGTQNPKQTDGAEVPNKADEPKDATQNKDDVPVEPHAQGTMAAVPQEQASIQASQVTVLPPEESQAPQTPEEIEKYLKEKAEEASESMKEAFRYVLKIFDKSVSDDVLYANASSDNLVRAGTLLQASKRAGLLADMQRLSLNSITRFPCIVLLNQGHCVVFKDEHTVYDPVLKEERKIDDRVKEYIGIYTGYTVLIDLEDLTLSTFFKRTSVIFEPIGQFIPQFVEMSVTGFLLNILGIMLPFYTMNVYDRVIPNNAFDSLLALTIGVCLGYIFELIFRVVKVYIGERISADVGKHVDKILMERLLTMRPPGLPLTVGAKQNLFREASMVREFYFSRFIPTLIDMPFLILFFIVLFLISPLVLLVPIVGSIVIFLANIFFQVPLQLAHEKMMKGEQGKTSFLAETMAGIESLKIFNGVGKRMFRWSRLVENTGDLSLENQLWIQGASSFSSMVMQLVSVFVVVAGVFVIANNNMSVGALIACTTLSGRLMMPIIAFAGLIVRYRSIQQTLRNIERVTNYPTEDLTEDGASSAQKGPFEGRLTFTDVDFFYVGHRNPILQKCSFDIKPREKVAIIGRTGVGKSTITRLLTGLDFPNSGRVMVDGVDIHGIHPLELRRYVGYFPQRSQFFNGSLRDNIVLTGAPVSDERYRYVCAFTGVHEVVAERSGRGDDMVITEGGTNISGGQQQIIAFARTILQDPAIVIMDEPTNGMDTNLEAQFMTKVKSYIADKTFLLITHKAQQLVLVDRVILIDNGKIVVDDKRDTVLEMLSKGRGNI